MPTVLVLLTAIAGSHLGAAVELAGAPAGLAALAVAATGMLLVALLGALRAGPIAVSAGIPASAVRQRTERTAFLPLRDPAAPGRPRPRAPGARSRAA